MAIAVKCPGCQSSYRVAPDRIGSLATCQSCGQRFTLSMAADETLGVRVPASAGASGQVGVLASASPPAGASISDAPVRIGRYEIRERLGAGAFGTVYRAHDPDLDRDVALKVPQAGTLNAPGARERFLREAKAAARLHHPNIVPIHDVGQDGGGVFIVAAFIEGQTLAAALASGQVDRARGVEIAAKLADALHAAHQAGIVHRDVKPANVMLDRRGEPQLMDFGLAQLATASAQLTQQGTLMGTPCYMSPEQAMGEQSRIGPASDQYSLGVLLYESLCGRLPFEGPPLAVLYQVREKIPDAPRSIDPTIPPALEAICLRAMAKQPEDRFADCGQLARALRQVTVEARPAGRAPIAMGRREPPPSSAPPAPTIAETPAVKPTVAERWKRLDFKRRVAIGAGLLGCLLLMGVIIIVKTRDGEVRVETNDPNAEVTIDGPVISIRASGGAPSLGLSPPPANLPARMTNSIGMELALVSGGTFDMGADDGDANEKPVHRVTITRPFYLGTREVTQAQYEVVMGTNPLEDGNKHKGPNLPIVQVTWEDAVEFCRKLSQREGKTYRLPTEAEWEHACRAGTLGRWSFGDEPEALAEYAWTQENGGDQTHPVGSKKPNPLGLYDMHGNVWEFCSDWTSDYGAEAATDPTGPSFGKYRVMRGGSYFFPAWESRSANRPDHQFPAAGVNLGFRVLCEVDSRAADATISPVASSSRSDPPQPAIAPFDAEQAKQHQQAWADHLKSPLEFENSIGLQFILIPPGEFQMGAAADDPQALPDEVPQHQVRISQPMYLGVHEVTQEEYERVTGTNPSFFGKRENLGSDIDTKHWPVEQVGWNEAEDFCRRLTALPAERDAGRTYRLPTEAEWEYACRAGTTTTFTYGNALGSSQANFNGAYQVPRSSTGPWLGRPETVGKYPPNAFGLHDMLGNVWEWCGDSKRTYDSQPQTDPRGADNGPRLNRGGGWISSAGECRSSHRRPDNLRPEDRHRSTGLRVVCEVAPSVVKAIEPAETKAAGPAANSGANTPHVWPADAPAPAIAPFDAEQAKKHQEAWAAHLKVSVEYENGIGMKLVLIPPGQFTMGSPQSAPNTGGNEKPAINVTLTQAFWLGRHEVTQGQWKQVMKSTPWSGQNYARDAENAPVSWVGWQDAMDFCQELTKAEQAAGRLPEGCRYTLPTEAQWEYACRAGTTTRYHFGEDAARLGEHAWTIENAFGVGDRFMHDVGTRLPNAWGLHDMHGNAWEFCLDWHSDQAYAAYPNRAAIDPTGPATGAFHTSRGGSWFNGSEFINAAFRGKADPERNANVGFRVALAPVKVALQPTGVEVSAVPVADSFAGAIPGQQRDDNGLKLKLCWCPPGAFTMGSPDSDADASENEKPTVQVSLTEGFWIGKFEVTQREMLSVIDFSQYWKASPTAREGPEYPATHMGWHGAVLFCSRLTEAENQAGRLPPGWRYTLPTEAQWEYACRAGTTTRFHFGDGEGMLGEHGWFRGSTPGDEPHAHQVGLKLPNAWGLFDMHGNASEWCVDGYEKTAYGQLAAGGATNPVWPQSGSFRVIRGGGWSDLAEYCRSASRSLGGPPNSNDARGVGFRVVCAR